jgi:hypothetical protein
VNCSLYEPNATEGTVDEYIHQASWIPDGAQTGSKYGNCTFSHWQVQLKYVEREVPGNIEDPMSAGTAWGDICVIYDFRNITSCEFIVRRNREYKLRVRELCTDPLADSIWEETFPWGQGVCHSAPLVTPAPENVTASDPTANTFTMSWEAGDTDPDSCVFALWEIEVKPLNVNWPGHWMNLTGEETIYDDSISATNETFWKKVYWYVPHFVEDGHSQYNYYAVVPVGQQELVVNSVTFNGTSDGTFNLTINVSDVVNETRTYNEYVNVTDMVYGCSVRARNTTTCVVPVAEGGGVQYEARVREVCTDSTINSEWVYESKLDTGADIVTVIPEVVKIIPVLARTYRGEFLGFRNQGDR